MTISTPQQFHAYCHRKMKDESLDERTREQYRDTSRRLSPLHYNVPIAEIIATLEKWAINCEQAAPRAMPAVCVQLSEIAMTYRAMLDDIRKEEETSDNDGCRN
jgi:hypothetical protein